MVLENLRYEKRRHDMHMETGWNITSMELPKNLPEARGHACAGATNPKDTRLHNRELGAWAPTEEEALDALEAMISKVGYVDEEAPDETPE